MFNKTKIIATLGPASNSKETIINLIQAGVDVFRLNFSHGTHDQHAQTIANILESNKELDTHIGMLADLQGPKIRLGEVENGKVAIKTDDTIILTTKETIGTAEKLYVNYSSLAMDVNRGNRILIDDGKILLEVVSTNGIDEVEAKIVFGGMIFPKKGVNLPDTKISIPSLTSKDINDLEFILEQPINWIALSFVRSSEDILRLKGMLQYKNHGARVIAKVEKPEAIEQIDEIIRVADAVMVARGDLGVELPLEQVPVLQKEIVRKCIDAAKPVVIATQIMESMINNPFPTRAETTDIANAIFDGADALMLSGETAVGKHPVKVIETMQKVIRHIEKQDSIYYRKHTPDTNSSTFLSDAVCYNACRMANDVSAKGIIGMTKSGYTALLLSSYRPKANIFIFTESKALLNAVSLIWGVRAYIYNSFVSTDDTISDVQRLLKEKGLVETGDIVINTGSMPLHQRGRTNTIKVSKIS